MDNNLQFLDLIQFNIVKYGYHITIVNSKLEPRYAYTVGLKESMGFELIFAGGVYFLFEEVKQIFEEIISTLKINKENILKTISLKTLGSFSLSEIDASWSKLMMLGVYDYYKIADFRALQIIPEVKNHTLDIPNMSSIFDISLEPVWQWLIRTWDFNIPEDSTVISNLDALRGKAITEVMRWERNEWEMFAGPGPDVEEEDIRVISLATIIGIDKTLYPAMNVEINKGLWRESKTSDWQEWG